MGAAEPSLGRRRGGRGAAAHGLRVLGAAALLVLALGAFTPLASLANIWMAGSGRLEPAQAIVVLARGGADADGVLTNSSLRRTMHALDLYRRGLAPLIVFSGGIAEGGAEARLRSQLARGLGVPADAVEIGPAARTTRDEARGLAARLHGRGIRRILLVANPIDMPRARGVFARVGFTVLPAPTAASGPSQPEDRLALLTDIGVELLGLVYYRLAGWL